MIAVNGRFLGRTVTGVERFARMLLGEVHTRIAAGAEPPRWELLLPPGVAAPPEWPLFSARTVGRGGGHAWEQFQLPRAARGSTLLNLCNSGPIAPRRSLTVIHDALVYDLPENFSRPYRTMHQTLGHLIARRSHLATVSGFSRDRLAAVLKIDPARIPVIPNAANHVDAIVPDTDIVDQLHLTPGRFLLFVGSFAPNKNLPRALEAFARVARPDDRLVLVGAAVKSFAQNGMEEVPPGVILPGRISDAALMGLYRAARALVFPSLYEGFGIPPLEMMRFGRPVLAGDIPPVREVCGDAALYVDPMSVDAIAAGMERMLRDDALVETLAERTAVRANAYTWAASTDDLIAALAAI
ncbi:glycosyltransferase family 1 protein [Sphingomonas sp. PB2P12]|uniref:glycosyltransferase family 4 protein n=1 Tax=Sphingomonas sandaracina TaxID=3096157 RepID=UPI002FC90A07